ncbi:DUF4270 family protein [Dyadobacter psychrotolerans]|uniref:DUF4270 family protein n=1 Tax=Dyadobacter psychrotolerans TaxID=2541721 RepID=A0A4R5DIZ6_9BACT|nr:DUF4270 family protein [Dyadobacter psychrotolerans]TDE10493.1 DUF4270 family protein [Dyadobacter psychrotolerans]
MKFISSCFKTFSAVVPKFLVVTGLSLAFAGCQWGDQIEAIEQPNPDDFTALYSDTTSISISTVAPDSVMTGSSSRLFFGRYKDPYLGKMHAASFFQPSLGESSIALADKAVYDSLILSLRYDGYYYGDTMKVMNMSVHALTEDITLKNAYYNSNTTPYEAQPIGKISFYPTPRPNVNNARRDLKIKLSNTLGQKIFDMAKANLITNNTEFINVLKGIVVLPGASDNGSVVGFKTIDANTSIQLHYHTPDIEGVTKDSTVLQLAALYNQLGGDRSQTALAKLPHTIRVALPSAQTQNMSFIQAGPGIMTRVDLPTVRQLKYNNYSFANRAYIYIEPLKLSAEYPFVAPQTLYVYLCDKNNEYIRSAGYPVELSTLSGAPVTATLTNDLVNNKSFYRIDVSQYVSDILRSDSEEIYGLLLRTSAISTTDPSFPDLNTEFSKGFNRLIIGNQANQNGKLKLELYYTTVKIN